jgi:tRNA (cmo5U34)-methyltransferase
MLNKEFNTWQQDYNAKIRRWVPHYDRLLAEMVQLVDLPETPDFLDLGCGNGNAVALLLKKYPEAEYTLVDAAEDMIDACRQRFALQKNITYAQKYFQDLNLMPQSFDGVIAGLAFHHLRGVEKKEIFREIYRWLRPGGILSASDLYASKQRSDYRQEVMQSWETLAKSQGTSEREWQAMEEHHAAYDFPDSFEDQISWMKEAGFQDVKITYVSGYWGTVQAHK